MNLDKDRVGDPEATYFLQRLVTRQSGRRCDRPGILLGRVGRCADRQRDCQRKLKSDQLTASRAVVSIQLPTTRDLVEEPGRLLVCAGPSSADRPGLAPGCFRSCVKQNPPGHRDMTRPNATETIADPQQLTTPADNSWVASLRAHPLAHTFIDLADLGRPVDEFELIRMRSVVQTHLCARSASWTHLFANPRETTRTTGISAGALSQDQS